MSRKSKHVEQAAHHAQDDLITEDLSLLSVANVAALLAVPKSTCIAWFASDNWNPSDTDGTWFQRSAIRACINNRKEVSE